MFEKVLSDSWQGEASATVDATLASRYHERFADHAVSVAKKVVYLSTGDWTVETDAIDVVRAVAHEHEESGCRDPASALFVVESSVYFLPCAATAAAPAAAASGSRYSPGPSGSRFSSSR